MEVDESSQPEESCVQSSDESASGEENGDRGENCYTVPPWCRDPVYDRYWRHRQRIEQWFHHHSESENSTRHFNVPPPPYQNHSPNPSPLANHYYNLMMFWHQRYHRLLSEFQSGHNELYHHRRSSQQSSSRNTTTSGRGQNFCAPVRSNSRLSQSSCTSTDLPEPDSSRKRGKNSHRKGRHGRIEAKLAKRGGGGRIDATGTTFKDQHFEATSNAKGCMHGSDIIFDVDPQLLHGSQDEEDILECHMEITDEMLEFFAQSAIHRKERDAKKVEQEEIEKAPEAKFVDISKADKKNAVPTTLAPVERPGQKRTAEMKELYGRGAAMIHGMETAMQLNFDRVLDIKQPKHWPHLPLNIKFKD